MIVTALLVALIGWVVTKTPPSLQVAMLTLLIGKVALWALLLT